MVATPTKTFLEASAHTCQKTGPSCPHSLTVKRPPRGGCGAQELPSASSSTKGCTEKAAKCSELQSPAQLEQQSSVSGNSQPRDTPVKGLEEKREQEELPEAQATGDWDSDLQSVWLALFSKENEAEAEACALAADPWDEGHSKLFLTSEPEESSGFSASPFSGDPYEERATGRPAEHTALHKQLCMGPEDLVQLRNKRRDELEKLEEEEMYAELFGGIINEESPMTSRYNLRDPSSATLEPAVDPSVPLRSCCVTEEATAETQNCSELVSLELLADLGSDSEDSLILETLLNELLEKVEQDEEVGERDREVESPWSPPLQDEELEPAPTPPDSDLSDQEHSEPLHMALLTDPNVSLGCALPADPADEAKEAGMEAGHAQAAPPQEKSCGHEPPAGACPVPAQPLARSVPACPAGSAAVPQPPAPRPWRSMAKRARRALRRLFSFSCLRGQPEQ